MLIVFQCFSVLNIFAHLILGEPVLANYVLAFSFCVFASVLAEDISRGDGSLQASLHAMLLDGSLQEVASILSKALYGEPMV